MFQSVGQIHGVENCEGTHNSKGNLTQSHEEFPPIPKMAGSTKNARRSAIPPASYREALMKGANRFQRVRKDQMDGSGGLWSPSSTMYVLAQ